MPADVTKIMSFEEWESLTPQSRLAIDLMWQELEHIRANPQCPYCHTPFEVVDSEWFCTNDACECNTGANHD